MADLATGGRNIILLLTWMEEQIIIREQRGTKYILALFDNARVPLAAHKDHVQGKSVVLDRTDEAILRIVEQDGRISFAELAERINLSRTPCWTRVQNLERQHFISAYRAELNPRLLGLDTHAFVQVRIVAQEQRAFEAAVARNGSVLECYGITGEADYLLHLLVSGTGLLDEVLRNEIASMPGVKGTLTSLALRTIKSKGLIMDCRRDQPKHGP